MADIIKFSYPFHHLSKSNAISQITHTNIISREFNLSLSSAEAEQILAIRDQALRELGRVDLSIEIVKELIETFCRSHYIHQHNYAAAIGELVQIFYYLKNETRDQVGDTDLLLIMRECFDNHCCGSTELLPENVLAILTAAVSKCRFGAEEEDFDA